MRDVLMAQAGEGPNFADWLQGWGSVAAVAATVALLWHEIREARRGREAAARERLEAAEDRLLIAAERRDAEKTQARTIVIGDTYVSLYASKDVFFADHVKTSVHNYGSGPILDVTLELASRTEDVPDLPVALRECAALGLGESLTFDDRPLLYTAGMDDDDVPGIPKLGGTTRRAARENTVVAVRFTDATGRRWRRVGLDQPVLDLS